MIETNRAVAGYLLFMSLPYKKQGVPYPESYLLQIKI
jgi:hypothetical protein